jgi:hypothetical protein
MMKAMDSVRGQGANRSKPQWHCEDLQRHHRDEVALSCFEISASAYQMPGIAASDLRQLICSNRFAKINAAASQIDQHRVMFIQGFEA